MTEHYDVIVVGAGLSGVGAGARLLLDRPGTTFADPRVARARSAAPGTCSATRACAPTPTCTPSATRSGRGRRARRSPTARRSCEYVEDTAREIGVDRHDARCTTASTRADWSSEDARWTVTAERTDTGASVEFTCAIPVLLHRLLPLRPRLLAASSRAATTSPAPSCTRSTGPADLDYAGKRVVVIGSGATAMTLVPAMARDGRARHDAAALADVRRLAAVGRPDRRRWPRRALPAEAAYRVVRTKNIATSALSYRLLAALPARDAPHPAMDGVAKQLPEGYDVETHFGPSYGPWDQRLCVVPDGDLFTAITTARPRSSPTGSCGSRATACCSGLARSSLPTSSSPRPAASCSPEPEQQAVARDSGGRRGGVGDRGEEVAVGLAATAATCWACRCERR